MPRKGENIYKRKDGRWEGRYIKDRLPDGKAVYGYVYARSYRELKNDMVCIHLQRERHQLYATGRAQATDFQSAADQWLESIRPHIKESTRMKYQNLMSAYILPTLGSQSLRNISYEKIEHTCNLLLTRGGSKGTGLSPKTVSDVLSLIRNILKYAADSGKIPACDTSAIAIRQNAREMRVLSRGEQEQLCTFLCEHPSLPNIGILLCLFTGLRVGELCALQWEDISLREHTLHVHQTMQRIQNTDVPGKKTKVIVTEPKSRAAVRTIPLPEYLVNTLRELPQPATGYFLTGNKHTFMEPRTMQNHFKRVLENCAIRPANFHALRHTFATRCVELGFDVKSLSEILGHASVTITMNRYVHPSIELKRNNMERLSALFTVK